jgi:hypothetical protein
MKIYNKTAIMTSYIKRVRNVGYFIRLLFVG